MSETGAAPVPAPDATLDGGDLDCGSGLLLLIREAMAPLPGGGVLRISSRETSVKEELPAWCRMVGHTFLGVTPLDARTALYDIRKQGDDDDLGVDLETARNFAWNVRVRWNEGLRATGYARNHTLPVGQPASFDTEDAAPAAVELLLTALGGCLAVGLAWRASRKGVTVHQLEVALSATADNILTFLGIEGESGHPGLARIEAAAYVACDADEEDVEELWRETVARSPVAQTLLRSARLELRVRCT